MLVHCIALAFWEKRKDSLTADKLTATFGKVSKKTHVLQSRVPILFVACFLLLNLCSRLKEEFISMSAATLLQLI